MSSSATSLPAPATPCAKVPYLLTTSQGAAARRLLDYVAGLPLAGADAQLLAVVVAIRSARGGMGNLTGTDLRSLRLEDPRDATDALRGMGWDLPEALLAGDLDVPVAVTVPELAAGVGHPLPFGKMVRSRVSGWTTRTLTAKPVKKLAPAARLAALFMAAHSTSTRDGAVPGTLPEACRTVLVQLVDKGFLEDVSGDHYRLSAAVRHLSGLRPRPEAREGQTVGEVPPQQPSAQERGDAGRAVARTRVIEFDAAGWERWKAEASPALRRHAEAVQNCAVCARPVEQVAEAFMTVQGAPHFRKRMLADYGKWKETVPDRGPLAARFTVAFRAEHGHGPSHRQLCDGLGWALSRDLCGLVVRRLLANGWLMDTGAVPWTLRPGPQAQVEGIVVPQQATAPAGETAVR